MEIFIIAVAAFATALLTFFSGFGLGTILLPVFAIFFPIDVAIALTGVVHLSNNLFKLFLVGKHANRAVLMRFGVAAVLASFAGAWLLVRISSMPIIFSYQLWDRTFEITVVKLIIAFLLIFFALFEIAPATQKLQFGRKHLIQGGALSGFFGGLAGIQGALRSAFLIKSGLAKEAYIATGVVIASLVDITRLSVYASRFETSGLHENIALIIVAILSAIAGAVIGKLTLKKITLRGIQWLVGIMLILVSLALGSGLI
jgi:uncharacterized protein